MTDPKVNPPLTTAVQDLVAAAFEVRRVVISRTGLTETDLEALEHMVDVPSSPGDLARHLGVSTAASSGIVDRLERHGHVVRRAHPSDRRRQEVHLTASGRTEFEHHLRPMLVALAELEADLTEGERNTILRFLSGATEAFAIVVNAPS